LTETIRIFEIYDSIQGESTLAGMPCTIVRLAGCPLRCNYCDTRQALPFSSGRDLTIDEILADLHTRGMPLVLVSGGEPLAQKGTLPMLALLAEAMPIVQLETSGAFCIENTHPAIRRILDIKAPGSGEEEQNRWQNLDHLHDGDEIKFVLTGRADYEWALDIIDRYRLTEKGVPLLFSPAWGQLELRDLSGWIVQDRPSVRMHLQMHKTIWGPKATAV